MIVDILYVLLALALLGVLVTVHEFGHYIVGRLTGIGIVEFSVGMGPKIFGWKRKGIDYSLRAIPLGGYCAFLGENEANSAANAMNNQRVWKRLLTVLAGPAMNFLFAIVIVVVLLSCYPYDAESIPSIHSVVEDTPAEAVGIEPGDMIVEVNGRAVTNDYAGVTAVSEAIKANPKAAVSLTLEREGERIALEVTPEGVEQADGTIAYQIGIIFGNRLYQYTFSEALIHAPEYAVNTLKDMLTGLKNLVFKGEGVEEVGGPVAIVTLFSQAVRNGMFMVLYLLYMISLNLGVMNLLPIPGLDGGRILFLMIEAVRRKPIPPEKEGAVNAVGILLVLGLIVVVTFQDVARLIAG